MANLAIRTEQLTRDFATVRAVDHLDLSVAAGSVFGLLGPSGAGKSTTIRLLLGLLEPTSGSAAVLGFDVRSEADAIRAHTGSLLEADGLHECLNGEENLDLYARIWHIPAPERAARTRELLTHFDLWERRHEPVANWSHGMKQKLVVARALLHRPALILLDEPTGGLDATAAAALRTDLASLAANEGVTVFLATSNLAEAEQICHRIGILRCGELLAEGRPGDLCRSSPEVQLEIVGLGFTADMVALISHRREVKVVRPLDGRLWVELSHDAPSAPLVNLLVDSGAEVEEVHRHRASLEAVYRTLLETDHEQQTIG